MLETISTVHLRPIAYGVTFYHQFIHFMAYVVSQHEESCAVSNHYCKHTLNTPISHVVNTRCKHLLRAYIEAEKITSSSFLSLSSLVGSLRPREICKMSICYVKNTFESWKIHLNRFACICLGPNVFFVPMHLKQNAKI
jgi:hypothetical protein